MNPKHSITGFLIVFHSISLTFGPVEGEATSPLRICMISGSDLYQSQVSLPKFKQYLETQHNVEVALLQSEGKDKIHGLEALDDCDVALFFTRRRTIEGEQLDRVRRYALSWAAGRESPELARSD